METISEIGINVLLLQEQVKHSMEVNELQHTAILNKLETLEAKMIGQHIICDKKFGKLEKGYDNFREWKIYNIALITFIGFVLPYILDKLFS